MFLPIEGEKGREGKSEQQRGLRTERERKQQQSQRNIEIEQQK